MYKVIVIDDEMLVRRGIVMETDWQALNCVEISSGSADLRYPYAQNGRYRNAEGTAGRRQ